MIIHGVLKNTPEKTFAQLLEEKTGLVGTVEGKLARHGIMSSESALPLEETLGILRATGLFLSVEIEGQRYLLLGEAENNGGQ